MCAWVMDLTTFLGDVTRPTAPPHWTEDGNREVGASQGGGLREVVVPDLVRPRGVLLGAGSVAAAPTPVDRDLARLPQDSTEDSERYTRPSRDS